MKITSYILPVFISLVLLFGIVRRVPVFECFSQGAEKGISTCLSLLPVLTGLMVGIYMLQASGALDILCDLLSPVFSLFGIDSSLVSLCVLSPVSGSGSLSVYETILAEYGADSQTGRIASVIAGSTETTFYALSVYFGSQGIKKYTSVVPCALLGDFVSFIMAGITVRLFF